MRLKKVLSSIFGLLVITGSLVSILKASSKNISAEAALHSMENKMVEEGYEQKFIEDLLLVFKKRVDTYGEKEFIQWLKNLHYRVPEEFQNEQFAIKIYERYHPWIEKELKKLENETKLSWEEQSADITHLDVRARKAQLVIRHRLSEIVYMVVKDA